MISMERDFAQTGDELVIKDGSVNNLSTIRTLYNGFHFMTPYKMEINELSGGKYEPSSTPCMKNWKELLQMKDRDLDYWPTIEPYLKKYSGAYGVCTGEYTGDMVIAVETDKEMVSPSSKYSGTNLVYTGENSAVNLFADLITYCKEYGMGPSVLVPGGGLHYYFQYDRRLAQTRTWTVTVDGRKYAIHVYSTGGQVPGPGSQFATTNVAKRKYLWQTYGKLECVNSSMSDKLCKILLGQELVAWGNGRFSTLGEYERDMGITKTVSVPVVPCEEVKSTRDAGVDDFFAQTMSLGSFTTPMPVSAAKVEEHVDAGKEKQKPILGIDYTSSPKEIANFVSSIVVEYHPTVPKKVEKKEKKEEKKEGEPERRGGHRKHGQSVFDTFKLKTKEIMSETKFSMDDPYDFSMFREELLQENKVFTNYMAMEDELVPKIKRFVCVIGFEGVFLMKAFDGNGGTYTTFARGHKFLLPIRFNAGKATKKIDLAELIEEKIEYLCQFDTYGVFPPGSRALNISVPPIATRLLEDKEVSLPDVKPVLDYIMDVWANGNKYSYAYILEWLSIVCCDVPRKSRIALVAHSKRQQTGKDIFIAFIRDYVLGPHLFSKVDFGTLTEAHSTAHAGKRLVCVSEMPSLIDGDEKSLSKFDCMNGLITDDKITVSDKCGGYKDVNNISEFIFTTNHIDSLHLSQHDRRYAIFGLNESHVDDYAFFGRFVTAAHNMAMGSAFYEFLRRMPHEADIHDIPRTQERESAKEASKNSTEHYLAYLAERLGGKEPTIENINGIFIQPEGKRNYAVNVHKDGFVQSTELYNDFCEWAEANGYEKVSGTKFSMNAKVHIPIKRSGKTYFDMRVLSTLPLSTEDESPLEIVVHRVRRISTPK